MPGSKLLPAYLVRRFGAWRTVTYARNRPWYLRLAEEGQHPRTMIITCCDSRIDVGTVFGAEPGEFFIHRNIASLVPPFEPDGDRHGTSAAIEYAVRALHVAHVLVLGHSRCGGVSGCHDMCMGEAPELEAETSFVGRWMDILRPAFGALSTDPADRAARIEELGHAAVAVSIRNLETFPFVASEVATGALSLHGAYLDISTGEMEALDLATGEFRPIGAV